MIVRADGAPPLKLQTSSLLGLDGGGEAKACSVGRFPRLPTTNAWDMVPAMTVGVPVMEEGRE